MFDVERNKYINKALEQLYDDYNEDFVKVHNKYYPDSKLPRINVFGIINESQYDYYYGVLVVGKETNGWSDKSFADNIYFRSWLNGISQNGLPPGEHVARHPLMWYNIGRWVNFFYQFMSSMNNDYSKIVQQKAEALQSLGRIAFTNLNKGRGLNSSRKEFEKMVSNESIVWDLLKKEIALINPSFVICCGVYNKVSHHLGLIDGRDKDGRIFINMPHPANRFQSKESMLISLREQLKPHQLLDKINESPVRFS